MELYFLKWSFWHGKKYIDLFSQVLQNYIIYCETEESNQYIMRYSSRASSINECNQTNIGLLILDRVGGSHRCWEGDGKNERKNACIISRERRPSVRRGELGRVCTIHHIRIITARPVCPFVIEYARHLHHFYLPAEPRSFFVAYSSVPSFRERSFKVQYALSAIYLSTIREYEFRFLCSSVSWYFNMSNAADILVWLILTRKIVFCDARNTLRVP